MKKSNMALALLAFLACYAQAALALHIGPTPIETFERPLFKSAALVRTNSHASQYAGRTTIASGSATVVVSTRAVNSDSLIAHYIQAAVPAAYTSQGIISVVSGSTSGTASTTAVFSGQQIDLSMFNATNQLSGFARGFRTNSIVDGVSFAVVTEDGQSMSGGTAAVGWRIPESVPFGLKVNTIGVGNFTLGWADQKPRPIDATIMWEIRRST